MANKALDLLNKLIGDPTSGKKLSDDNLSELQNQLKKYDEEMAKRSQEQLKHLREIAELEKEINKLRRQGQQGEIKSVQDKIDNNRTLINKSKAANKKDAKKLDQDLEDYATLHDASPNAVKRQLDDARKSLGSFGDGVKSFTGGLSKGGVDAVGFIKDFTKVIEVDLVAAFAMAGAQIASLNDRLIKFQRQMGGALNARMLGYDVYGNNISGASSGSLMSRAERSGVNVDEVLQTYEAFNQGQIMGGIDLSAQKDALQDYGIEIAKLSKQYGIQSSAAAGVAQVLTYQYGTSVRETSRILEHGAKVAASAGLNVGKFFENLKQIADLQGDMYIAGGAEGLERAAYALSKLGATAKDITKLQGQFTDFSNLINKQGQTVALGLNNYATHMNQIFAKMQVGKGDEALTIQRAALAQDMKNWTDKNGIIMQPGVNMLKAAGMDGDEIDQVQRLIKLQERLGATYEQMVDETKLSTAQLTLKRQIEQEEMTVQEKLTALWGQVRRVFVDPLATVLGPALSVVLSGVTAGFKLLSPVISVVTFFFQIVGRGLTNVANTLQTIITWLDKTIEEVSGWLGLGTDKEGEQNKESLREKLEKITDWGGKIFALLTGWWLWTKGRTLANKFGSFATSTINTISGNGQGKLSNLWKSTKQAVAAGPTKKDGTPDMRYAANRQAVSTGGFFDKVKSMFNKTFEAIGTKWGQLVAKIHGTAWPTPSAPASDITGNLIDNVTDNIDTSSESGGKSATPKKGIRGFANKISSKSKGLLGKVGSFGKNIGGKIAKSGLLGKIGKGAVSLGKNAIRGLGPGLIAGMAADWAEGAIEKDENGKGKGFWGKMGLVGTETGKYAAMGSIVGPWGTAVGAGIGAIVGFTKQFWPESDKRNKDKQEQVKISASQSAGGYSENQIAEIKKVMQSKVLGVNYAVEGQRSSMAESNSGSNPVIHNNITVKTDLLGNSKMQINR